MRLFGVRRSVTESLLGAAVLALSFGCASGGAVDAALHQDLAALSRSIKAEGDAGELSRSRVSKIAAAVVSREVYSGKGPASARRIRAFASCASSIDDVLFARAERKDDGGAEAMLLLVSRNAVQRPALVEEYADADSGAWRAVAARSATEPASFPLRRRFFSDPDERVRRSAFEAAIQRASELDTEALLEAARLEPDPYNQALATRAAGALGGERVVRALRDFWERSDEPTRIAIVEAWAMPTAFRTGGRAELSRVAQGGTGLPELSAAAQLVRLDSGSSGAELTRLIQAAKDGSIDERRLALRSLPLSDRTARQALSQASVDADSEASVLALSRLLGDASESARARSALKKLASGRGRSANLARDALAGAGDASVVPQLLVARASSDAAERQAAGRGLLSLERYAELATLLGDRDANVRSGIACSVLARETH
jgi:hypothetical protein